MLKRRPASRIGGSSVLVAHCTALRHRSEGCETDDRYRTRQEFCQPSLWWSGRIVSHHNIHVYFVATRNRNTPSHSAVMQCQYNAITSVAVFRSIGPVDNHPTASKPAMPPRRCKPCATVNT